MKNLPYDYSLRILTAKNHPKIIFSANEKYERGHLGRYIKSYSVEINTFEKTWEFCIRFLNQIL